MSIENLAPISSAVDIHTFCQNFSTDQCSSYSTRVQSMVAKKLAYRITSRIIRIISDQFKVWLSIEQFTEADQLAVTLFELMFIGSPQERQNQKDAPPGIGGLIPPFHTNIFISFAPGVS